MWFTINIEQTHFFSLSFKVASYLSSFISHYFPVQNSLSTRFVTILLSQTYRLTHTNILPYAYTLLILVSVMLCHYFFYLKCFPFFSIGNSIRASLTSLIVHFVIHLFIPLIIIKYQKTWVLCGLERSMIYDFCPKVVIIKLGR